MTALMPLIERAREGDREALEQVCSRYLPLLRRWARGRLSPRSRGFVETDDIVQETIVAALRNLGRLVLDDEGALSAYLRQAVRNRILNEARRASHVPARVDGEPVQVEDPGRSPLQEAIDVETVERYERALARLSETDRAAVTARLELGLGYPGIAELLGKPTAEAARVAVGRAVARLARELDRVPG